VMGACHRVPPKTGIPTPNWSCNFWSWDFHQIFRSFLASRFRS
jgi:hypothetical protein